MGRLGTIDSGKLDKSLPRRSGLKNTGKYTDQIRNRVNSLACIRSQYQEGRNVGLGRKYEAQIHGGRNIYYPSQGLVCKLYRYPVGRPSKVLPHIKLGTAISFDYRLIIDRVRNWLRNGVRVEIDFDFSNYLIRKTLSLSFSLALLIPIWKATNSYGYLLEWRYACYTHSLSILSFFLNLLTWASTKRI